MSANSLFTITDVNQSHIPAIFSKSSAERFILTNVKLKIILFCIYLRPCFYSCTYVNIIFVILREKKHVFGDLKYA